jgi:two-component system sensor histidine kinase DegS
MTINNNDQPASIQEEIGALTQRKVIRQLHDGLTQTVSALAMRINYARRLINSDPDAASQELEKVEDLTREATREIRHIIYLLRPAGQGDTDLISDLAALVEKMENLFDLEINLDFNENLVKQFPADVQAVILRLVEELIDSARKMDKNTLFISLNQTKGDLVQLIFEIGIDGDKGVDSLRDLDLDHIQTYANLIDGSVVLGKDGNVVQVLVPLNRSK